MSTFDFLTGEDNPDCGFRYKGHNDLTDKTKRFIKAFDRKNMMAITNLYKDPSKLKQLKKFNPDVLVIDTTLFNQDNIESLLEAFKLLEYEPKHVVYLNKVISTEFSYEKWEG